MLRDVLRISACLSAFVLSTAAWADDYDCVKATQGRNVRWDKDWQKDARDDDVLYKVKSIVDQDHVGQPREITVTLEAVAEAAQSQRVAVITRELGAQLFCTRVEKPKDKGVILAVGGNEASRVRSYEIATVYRWEPVTPEDLSFRVLSKGIWVPARPKPGEEQFVCQVNEAAYACNRNDYSLVENIKIRTGSVPRIMQKINLPGPFIRHTSNGWVQSTPLGIPTDTAIAQCKVGGTAYYCIAREKEAHLSELKELGRELNVTELLARDPL